MFERKQGVFASVCVAVFALIMLGGAVYKQDWTLFSLGAGFIVLAFMGLVSVAGL